MEYEEAADPAKHDGIAPDNCIANIAKILPGGEEDEGSSLSARVKPSFYSNSDEFSKIVEEERFTFNPPGELIRSWEDSSVTDGTASFELWKGTPEDVKIREYVKRINPFLLWHIECASAIDLSDKNWLVFLL